MEVENLADSVIEEHIESRIKMLVHWIPKY